MILIVALLALATLATIQAWALFFTGVAIVLIVGLGELITTRLYGKTITQLTREWGETADSWKVWLMEITLLAAVLYLMGHLHYLLEW